MCLAPHATLVHHDGRVTLNDRALEMFGTDEISVEGVSDGRLHQLGDDAQPWTLAAASGQDRSVDLHVVDPLGVEHWVTAESRVTDLGDGRSVVVTSVVDTTERQQWARTILDDLRTRFETAWTGSSIPVFLLAVEPAERGRVLFANAAMLDLVGAGTSDLFGRDLCDLLVDRCHRESYDGGIDALLAGEDAEQTFHVELRRFDDAEPRPAMLGLSATRSVSGRPAFIVGIALDHEPLASAEREHHRSLLRIEAMYERSADLVVFISPDGTLELVGPSVESMLGFDRDELRGTNVSDLVHPDDLSLSTEAFVRSLHETGTDVGGRSRSMRLRIRDAADEWHPVEVVSTSGGANQEIEGLVVTVRDRAQEEQLEREALMLDERARQIVETAVDGIWVVDEVGRTTYVNSSLATMLGTSPDAMLGSAIHDYMDDDGRMQAETLVERRRAGVHEAFGFTLTAVDGRVVDTYVSTRPLYDESGTYSGAVAWITDVTDRLEAAERLGASEAHLRALLAAFPDLVVRMDREGTYLEVYNAPDDAAAESAREVLGITVAEAYPDDVMPGVAKRCLADIEAALDGRTVTTEYQLPGEDGIVSAEARFAPLGNGEVLSLVRDVTELRNAEAARNEFSRELDRRAAAAERLELERELERASRLEAMGHLAGGVAHDVNNLLGVIGNYAAAMSRTDDPAQIRADAAEIAHAVDRGAALTRQLLQVGRPAGSTTTDADVHEVVVELADTLRGSFAPGTELLVSAAAGDCRSEINRGRVEQAVMNLVMNARDALEGHGRVLVSVSRSVDTRDGRHEVVVVRVADDGHGMAPSVSERAFEPFFTTKDSGTGIGLAIVRAVAEEHGGCARVENTVDGTAVSIALAVPVRRPSGAPSGTIVEGAPEQATGPVRSKVLLVDDDRHVRRATARLVRELGHCVVEAQDGSSALAHLASDAAIDVVVTDVRMPRMTGPQLADRIEALHPDVPVVFVTGFAHELLAERPEAVDRLLTKPYDAVALSRMLEDVRSAPVLGTSL